MSDAEFPPELAAAITKAGYFPQLVISVLDVAIAGEDVVAFLVQPETTFDEEIRRHLTVLALTPTRLISAHVDDHEGDEEFPASAAATTESVPLAEIKSVVLTHLIAEPAKFAGGEALAAEAEAGEPASELNIAISWGGVSRFEIEPMVCANPDCEGDHGAAGQIVPDDIVVRVASEAEGPNAKSEAVAFARQLSAATARALR
jgi:hypothetical protein